MNFTINTFQFRRKTTGNPVLLEGEPSYDVANNRLVIGDGTTVRDSLPSPGAPGSWTTVTPPTSWSNFSAFVGASEPDLSFRTAGDGQAQVRGTIMASAADVATALGGGGISFSALVPADFRPTANPSAIINTPLVVITTFGPPAAFVLATTTHITSAGDMVVASGVLLGDGTTDLATFLGGLSAMDSLVLLSISGVYPIT